MAPGFISLWFIFLTGINFNCALIFLGGITFIGRQILFHPTESLVVFAIL